MPTENTLDREEKTMAEWVERKITDIGTVVGGATPSTKKPENYENVDKSFGVIQAIFPSS